MKIISGDEQSLLLGWHLVSGGENIGLPDHLCMEKKDGKWMEQGLQESVLWKLLAKESDREKPCFKNAHRPVKVTSPFHRTIKNHEHEANS